MARPLPDPGKLSFIMSARPTSLGSEGFYKTLLDSLFDAVFTVDSHGTITYWNESCSRLTGYTTAEMVGQNYSSTPLAYAEEHEDSQSGGIQIVMETGMPGTWKGYLRRKNGQRIPIESHVSPLRNNQGEAVGAVEIFRDISAHVSLEQAHQQVLQMSRKDLLTGLYNRAAISELLKAEIERSRRYRQPLSAIMIDIDHFKRINDRYGHDAGDKVLAKIGAILAHNLRKPDVVGRWGGEEFLIVTPGSDSQAAATLAERLRGFIKAIPEDDTPERITATFGIAQHQAHQNHDQLLYVADQALYRGKDSGRDRVTIGVAETSTVIA
jgi:diguanylate cyclase (GGDEF)-like protein/PAS domain S-box-containing protein